MIKVVALDPGETTGYAIGVINQGLMDCKSDQARWNHLNLYDFLTLHHADFIVCESFDFRKSSDGANLYPRELIGVVNLYVQALNLSPIVGGVTLHMQSPAEAKGPFQDKILKQANLYNTGKPHSNDAMRHLLQWYMFKQGYKYNKRGYRPWPEEVELDV